jgi:hypothetical protein
VGLHRWLERLGYGRRSDYVSADWLQEQLQREREDYQGVAIRWPIPRLSDKVPRAGLPGRPRSTERT